MTIDDAILDGLNRYTASNNLLTPEEKAWRKEQLIHFFKIALEKSPDIVFVFRRLQETKPQAMNKANSANQQQSTDNRSQRGYDTVFDDTYPTTGRGITGPVPKSKLIKAEMGEAEAIRSSRADISLQYVQ